MDPSSSPTSADTPLKKTISPKVVVLSHEAHGQLGKAAKKFKMTNSDFANLAIAYFTETGLDPRKASKASLAKLEQRVVQETFDVREHNANIGNRLVGVIRTFERNIGLMIQQQQLGTFKYLEGIERNILSHLVGMEEDLLNTILERVVAGNVESYINRVILQVLSLQLDAKRFPFSEKEVDALTVSYDDQRNRQIVVESRKLLEAKKVSRPKASVAPALVEIPKAPSTAKSAAGTPGQATATPAAATGVAPATATSR